MGILERVKGIEPSFLVWKTSTLTVVLYPQIRNTLKCDGFEPSKIIVSVSFINQKNICCMYSFLNYMSYLCHS